MIKLSYSTFGLTNLSFLNSIEAVDRAGYEGIELSFHRDQFNPFDITDADLAAVKEKLHKVRVKPACIATASHFFMPSRPHEPSLMCTDLAGRKRRISLVKRGIYVARELGVPLVTFGSGFIRHEHINNPKINPRELLVDSIEQCLNELRPDENMLLLIEPEPGMFIETIEQALSLVEELNSPHFRLHLDLCHIYCSEKDYLSSLVKAAPYARYLHVSDAQAGYNLKILRASESQVYDLDFASYLIYFTEDASYLFVNRQKSIYFSDNPPSHQQGKMIEAIVCRAAVQKDVEWVDYGQLFQGATQFDEEIFTFLISVPDLSFDVLERAKPIIAYLRSSGQAKGKPFMDRMVANTLTGIVHYHEIPGEGTLDFAASFKTLNDNGFSGYASVELYHHVQSWEKALNDSFRHLSKFV